MHVEGMIQWAHGMNRYVRGGFGLDFMRQLANHIGKFDELRPALRTFYASHNIGRTEAAEMHALLLKHHKKVVNGKLMIPNSAAWIKAGREDLLRKYKAVVKAAGDEAMLDPGVGDRPFLRSSPFGSLLIQFQSFMFTASERFVAPMVQTAQIHPREMRIYAGVLASIQLGIMVDMIKAGIRGPDQLEQWFERWNSQQGMSDNLWSGLLRSPLLTGNSSILLEAAMTSLGPTANRALGAPVFGANATRFRQQGVIQSLLGAAVGRADRLTNVIVQDFLQGDTQRGLDKLMAMTPWANTLPIGMLKFMYEITAK